MNSTIAMPHPNPPLPYVPQLPADFLLMLRASAKSR
jgi:hypothetical protein